MVNLLPEPQRRAHYIHYYLRLFSTLFLMWTVVVAGGSIFLLPSYFLSRDESDSAKKYLEAAEGKAGIQSKQQVGKEVSQFADEVKALKLYGREPLAAKIFSTFETHLSKEIVIKAVALSFGDEEIGKITLTGVAKTRTALLSFAESVREESLFTGVSVPVSQLAGDTNLPFSLSFGFKKNTSP